jgi:hypothetical protein
LQNGATGRIASVLERHITQAQGAAELLETVKRRVFPAPEIATVP